jgi:hypothetical protein
VLEEVAYSIELMSTFEWEADLPAHEMLGMSSRRRVRQQVRAPVLNVARKPLDVCADLRAGEDQSTSSSRNPTLRPT